MNNEMRRQNSAQSICRAYCMYTTKGLTQLFFWICFKIRLGTSLSVISDKTPHRVNSHPFPGLFIFGYGNVGKAVSNLLTTDHSSSGESYHYPTFSRIYASTRSPLHVSDKESTTTTISFVPLTDTTLLNSCLSACSHILITIPPIMKLESQTNSTDDFYKDVILDSDIFTWIPTSSWLGFLSTTGVYGDHGNDWVDETSDTLKYNSSGVKVSKAAAYLDLEQRWKRKRRRGNLRIFRCAGIYGTHASALHTILKNGFPEKDKVEDERRVVPTSRIHVEDVARALVLSMSQYKRADTCTDNISLSLDEEDCEIYNVSDDEPASRFQVFSHASNLLFSNGWTVVRPTGNTTTLVYTSERHQRRLQESKRVRNQKMKDQLLGPIGGLKYKTYREGLLSIVQYLRADSTGHTKSMG